MGRIYDDFFGEDEVDVEATADAIAERFLSMARTAWDNGSDVTRAQIRDFLSDALAWMGPERCE